MFNTSLPQKSSRGVFHMNIPYKSSIWIFYVCLPHESSRVETFRFMSKAYMEYLSGRLTFTPFLPMLQLKSVNSFIPSVNRLESQEFMACRWQSMQARDPPWLWNTGEMLPEVQNRGTSGPTKRTHVLQKVLKKSVNRLLHGIFMWKTLLEDFCGRLVLNIYVEDWWNNHVEDSWMWKTQIECSCGRLPWKTHTEDSNGILLWKTHTEDSHGILLWKTYIEDLHGILSGIFVKVVNISYLYHEIFFLFVCWPFFAQKPSCFSFFIELTHKLFWWDKGIIT